MRQTKPTASRYLRLSIVAVAAVSAACFRLTGPEDPEPVSRPALVSVNVEYRQPNGCLAEPAPVCDDSVVFFATWMRDGGEFALAFDETHQVWRGTALAVPVNYPPRDDPYQVRVYDPYLTGSATQGITANRLTVGGEFLTRFTNVGFPDESALLYVDADGHGHNAF
jgi:hypothetical protein